MECYCLSAHITPFNQEEIKIKRVKFRISTWKEGRTFMKEVAAEFNAKIEVQDDNQLIITEGIEIRFHPDDRGFSFITSKIHDESLESTLEKYRARYSKQ